MAEKIKITKSEVIQMIKEEYQRKQTEITLKKRLDEVNSKIKNILKESGIQNEETLEEVEASGEEKVRSTAWTGKEGGDTKYKPKFDIKGTHKLEEDDDDGIEGIESAKEEILGDETPEMSGEEAAVEIGDEMAAEMGAEESEDIEDILRKLADAIEDKVEDVVDAKLGGEADEEIGDAIEDAAEEDLGAIGENAEESQNGHSPATDVSRDAPGEKIPFTEKQDTIKEGTETGKIVLTEEIKRAQVLAGLRKSDELI